MALEDIVNDEGVYLIPVSWSVYSTIKVEADNLKDAIERARRSLCDIPLSSENEYIDDSYTIDGEIDEDFINAQDRATVGDVLLKRDGTIERT